MPPPDGGRRRKLARCGHEVEQRNAAELAEERRKFETQAARIETRMRREELELEKEEDELQERRREELLSGAESVLSLFSKRRRTYRPLSQLSRQRRYVKDTRADIEESEEKLEIYRQQMNDLKAAWQAAAAEIGDTWNAKLADVREDTVCANRRDIDVRFCGLAWFPFWEVIDGGTQRLLPAYVAP